MRNNEITLQELLALEPLTDFKILAGWSQRKNVVKGLVDQRALKKEGTGKLLVLEGNGEVFPEEKEFWTLVNKIEPAGILILGAAHAFLNNCSFNDISLPVIHLPRASFQQVEETFTLARLLKKQGVFLPWLSSANGRWLKLLNEQGVSVFLAHLEEVLDSRVLLVDPLFEPVKLPAYEPRDWENWKNILPKLYQQYRQRSGKIKAQNLHPLSLNDHYYVICPLKAHQTVLGFLIVEEKNPWDELDRIQLQHAVPPLITELVKYQEILEVNRKYQDNFIYDLLHNNFESHRSLIQLGKVWGWDLSQPHYLFLLDYRGLELGKEASPEPAVLKKIISQVVSHAIVGEMEEQLVIMVAAGEEKSRGERKKQQKALAQELLDKIRGQFPQVSFFMGMGKFYPSTADLCRSYQEAKTALELGRLSYKDNPIYHFEDLGIMALLSSIRYEQLHDYCQEFLADLIAFDQDNKANLLETLQVYLAHNGDSKETAAKLYIHPNTLRYRLNKIEELLDVDLKNWGDLVNIYVALKIKTMLLTLLEG